MLVTRIKKANDILLIQIIQFNCCRNDNPFAEQWHDCHSKNTGHNHKVGLLALLMLQLKQNNKTVHNQVQVVSKYIPWGSEYHTP